MPHRRQELGHQGEAAALRYLADKGYKIICQNWHAGRYGEIDIVALQAGEVVIVEVKTRQQIKFGYPEGAVNQAKLNKLRLAAQSFMLAHPQLGSRYRVEVVALLFDDYQRIVDVKHYRNIHFDGKL
ncbi:MAG: YraN family protein [Candidatus Kerfeldbacteria bacterium]|nr:YraN family protein [Candidatus Kerfeldbacteria bacterium]